MLVGQVAFCLSLLASSPSEHAQEPVRSTSSRLPVVATLTLPSYPPIARAAGVQGTVVLRVRTDGHQVTVVKVVEGVMMLSAAAEENVRTWRFKPHDATAFSLSYHYELLGPFTAVHGHRGTGRIPDDPVQASKRRSHHYEQEGSRDCRPPQVDGTSTPLIESRRKGDGPPSRSAAAYR